VYSSNNRGMIDNLDKLMEEILTTPKEYPECSKDRSDSHHRRRKTTNTSTHRLMNIRWCQTL